MTARTLFVAVLTAAVLAGWTVALGSCSGAAGSPGGDNDTVSGVNPCPADGQGIDLPVRSPDLARAVDSGLVTWTAGPEIDPLTGTLSATGTLDAGAALFDPLDGDGPAFSVHYGTNEESYAELIPDEPAPGQCWRLPSSGVTVTLATFDELSVGVASFSFAASSPLFRDVGDDLVLRVWGTDAAGEPALLGSHFIERVDRK